jgi:endonuclease/exonuclease/phosphatase family metal-dependent hydrolase
VGLETSNTTERVRIMTLNCAHGRATGFSQLLTRRAKIRRNLDSIADLVTSVAPHVVALQELDAPSSWSGGFDQLQHLAERTGYSHSFHGLHVNRSSAPRLAYGTAILSKLPLSAEHSHAFGMNRLDTKGFAYAEVEVGGLRLAVVSLHLDFKRDSERRRQLAAVAEFLRQQDLGNRHLVVTGDFNSSVTDRNQVLGGFARELRLASAGPSLATFPSRRPRRALDDFLLSPGLAGHDKRALDVLVSDHLPVVLDVGRAEA